MPVDPCKGRWRYLNFELVDEGIEGIGAPTKEQIGEALFRVLEAPHDPRGVIWWEQQAGDFKGARVVQVAENWFLTYSYDLKSPLGDCGVWIYAFGEVPPK